MSETSSPPGDERSRAALARDFDVHLSGYLVKLKETGYAEQTRRNRRRLVAPFIRWVCEAGIAIADVGDACVDAFLARSPRPRNNLLAALRQFVEYLRAVAVVPHRHVEASPSALLVERYLHHLRATQGLSQYSINAYTPFVRTFVVAQRLPENAAAVDATAVLRHVLEHGRGRSASFVRLQAAALRSFLRFCFLDGITTANLSAAVLPVRRRQVADIPPFLTAEEVERVIAAADRTTARGCRAFAILLLLARLGLRAGEVLALELDDIRWEAGEIVVRGKGRVHDRLPLLADVGQALALYLSTARGPSRSRRVFVRRIAPRVGLSQPADISKIAREALKNAGLLPAGRVGAHIFRHSLATRMIQHGTSLTEISQVLRHRSIGTTQLYAKVEIEGLRAVALPWPISEVAR